MAKAHALTRHGSATRVAFHVVVPASGANLAGVQWRTALKNAGLVNPTVLASGNGTGGTISTAEGNDVTNGVVYEVVRELPIPIELTQAQVDQFLDEHHAALAVEMVADLQERLRFFGLTRT